METGLNGQFFRNAQALVATIPLSIKFELAQTQSLKMEGKVAPEIQLGLNLAKTLLLALVSDGNEGISEHGRATLTFLRARAGAPLSN